MLPAGTISRVHDYYFTAPQYRAEEKRALMEFLGDDPMAQYGGALFNEWFLYDFVMTDGYTPLEEFVARNPLSLPDAALAVYRRLHENTYSLFEVASVERRKGMALKDARTGTLWQVREDRATRSLRNGDLFFGRVGKVDDHHELIGADSLVFRGKEAGEAREAFQSTKKVSPKEAHHWMNQKLRGR